MEYCVVQMVRRGVGSHKCGPAERRRRKGRRKT